MPGSREIKAGTAVIYGIEHLLTDFMCHFFMFRYVYGIFSAEACLALFVLYNFLAFALQCPLGYFCDKLKAKVSAGISYTIILLVYLAVFLGRMDTWKIVYEDSISAKIWIIAAVVLLGIANSIFHAGGCKGVMCLGEKGLRNGGIFISFGALGVAFGDICGQYAFSTPTWIICGVALVIIEVAVMEMIFTKRAESDTLETTSGNKTEKNSLFAPALVLCLVAVLARSYGGFCTPGGYTEYCNSSIGLSSTMLSNILGFTGKLLGGFFVIFSVRLFKSKTDLRIANLRYGTIALLISALLCGLFGNVALPCTIGIILFHSVMPVTLYEVFCCFPDNPGFSLGLTTLMLFVGILPNYFFAPSGTVKTLVFVITTLVAAASLFLCARFKRVEKKKITEEA